MPPFLRRALLVVSFALVGLPASPALAQTTVTLQQGLNGYASTADTRITNGGGVALGTDPCCLALTNATIDGVLVRFAIFASEGGPVPNGSTISSATLSVYRYRGPGSQGISASRLLKDWTETGATRTATGTGASW